MCVCVCVCMPSKSYASYKTSLKNEKDSLNKCRKTPSSW